MSMNNQIKKMLDTTNLESGYLVYTGKDDTYLTFNFADERADYYGDDRPLIEVYSLQVHLFGPKEFNHLDLKETIKRLLFENGWTWPNVITLFENDNTERMHVIFECEKEAAING